MIVYQSDMWGFQNLLRMHGSPVYKVFIPTACSTGFLILLAYGPRTDLQAKEEPSVQHPYSIGAFIGVFSFLLTFRLNYGYQRYWEGATAIHQMLSKWVRIPPAIARGLVWNGFMEYARSTCHGI